MRIIMTTHLIQIYYNPTIRGIDSAFSMTLQESYDVGDTLMFMLSSKEIKALKTLEEFKDLERQDLTFMLVLISDPQTHLSPISSLIPFENTYNDGSIGCFEIPPSANTSICEDKVETWDVAAILVMSVKGKRLTSPTIQMANVNLMDTPNFTIKIK